MKKAILFFLILCCCSVLCASDYYIESLSVDISLNKNAIASVNESYIFNFINSHHGFYRYIPERYDEGQLKRNIKITQIKCSDRFEYEHNSGYLVMKIGSSSVVHKGLTPYELSYNYDFGADTFSSYDEFYFNLVGDMWEVPIKNAYFSVKIPCSSSDAQIWVTAGKRGSVTQIPYSVKNYNTYIEITGNAENIISGEAVTIRVQLPDNWYENARTAWDLRAFSKKIDIAVSFLVLLIAIFVWLKFGKDKIPVVYARFNVPKDFSPMLVGYIADNRVDNKDITSMLYYWADKGYLTIAEPKKNRFQFNKIKDLPEDTAECEKTLFNGFFKRGNSVTFKDLENSDFFETVMKSKAKTRKYFSGERSLEDKKAKALSFLMICVSYVPVHCFCMATALSEYTISALVGLIIVGSIFTVLNAIFITEFFFKRYVRKTNVFAALSCFIPLIVCFFSVLVLTSYFMIEFQLVLFALSFVSSAIASLFAVITRKRSQYGDKILEEVLGYKEYIEKVSVEELKLMIDSNPDYYYKVLSYAIVLGLENTWAKKFDKITVSRPSWYTGNYVNSAFFFSHMATRMTGFVVASKLTNNKAVRSIGGSGFGFSGFSGGGFGGGGGHAW